MAERKMKGRELIKAWVSWKSGSDGVRYTYKALAADAGLNQNYLSNVMTGIRNPGGKTLEKIADALGIGLGEFYLGPPESAQRSHLAVSHEMQAISANRAAQFEGVNAHSGVATVQENPVPDKFVTNHVPSVDNSESPKSESVSLKLGSNESDEISRLFSSFGFENGELLSSEDLSTALSESATFSVSSGKSETDRVNVPEEETAPAALDSHETDTMKARKTLPEKLPLLGSGFTGNLDDWLSHFNSGNGDYTTVPRYCGSDSEHAFAITLEDDSMSPDLGKGDMLIVDCDEPFERTNGGIGVAVNATGVKVRRVFLQNETYNLIPSNTSFPPEIVPESNTIILKIVLWIPLAEGKF